MSASSLDEERLESGFSGVVLVRRGDDVLLERGYGAADRERGRPNTPDTTFQIASNSKQFAAAAILLLQERGKLSVSDVMSRYVAEAPDDWQGITIHHLLTHTSGIGHWEDFSQIDLYAPMSRERLLEIFGEGPLKFAPGEGFAYSSPAYVLLAHIAEQVSGRRYADLLAEDVFGPLGMNRTGVGSAAPAPETHAQGYLRDDPVPSYDLDGSAFGAGDIWSTAGDLSRWNRSLARGEILSDASRAAMMTWHATNTPQEGQSEASGYGYGLYIGPLLGHTQFSHSGWNAGFMSFNTWLPDNDVSITVLSNDEETDVWGVVCDLSAQVV